jgi:hypothetical protein
MIDPLDQAATYGYVRRDYTEARALFFLLLDFTWNCVHDGCYSY